MSATTISAAVLITPEGRIENPQIQVDADGAILSIQRGPGDPAGTVLAPAFFDVHIHGAAGHDVMEATPAALNTIGSFLASRGVGHFLATTVTAPLDSTLRALDGLACLIESSQTNTHAATAVPIGIHLEGPFLSHSKRGVHPSGEIREPSIPLFERFWQSARGHIRLLTLAPEMPGALELCRYASGLGVRVSMGHSDATAAQARAAIVAGATSATHTFNAMRRLDHREPGIAGEVLDRDELYAELICDGIHVAPEFVRLWLLAKGPARSILITDGISATGMPEGEYDLGGLRVKVADGRCLLSEDLNRGADTLAGSVLTMDLAITNLRRFTSCTLDQALFAATRNPARMLGMDSLATVEKGHRANLVRLTRDGELIESIIGGLTVRPA